jgi:hypothetical protein
MSSITTINMIILYIILHVSAFMAIIKITKSKKKKTLTKLNFNSNFSVTE